MRYQIIRTNPSWLADGSEWASESILSVHRSLSAAEKKEAKLNKSTRTRGIWDCVRNEFTR